MIMDWSSYQTDIFTETKHNDANLSVQAVAGSGKSTTLFEIANRCTGNVLFLAFNKIIADYAKTQMGADVDCRTFHSYGLSLLKQEIGWYPKVDTNKVYDCIKQRHPYVKKEWSPRKPLNRIIKKMRALGFMSYEEEDIHEWISMNESIFSYSMKERAKEEAWAFKNIPEIQAVLRHLDEKPKKTAEHKYQTIIDFDDMVRFPCMYNLATRKKIYCHTVLVDEAQDMNPYQIHLINQLFKKNVRTICVGDSNQAIYAFRGAYSDSMERLANMTDAIELPLSVTYRCKSNLVDFTNKTIWGSEMVPFKEGGEVETILKDKFIERVREHNVPMIIGAKNKSLVRAWLLLAKEKIASTLKGTGIVEEIRRLLKDFKVEENGIEQLCEDMKEALYAGLYTDDMGEMQQGLPTTVTELYSCVQEIVDMHNIESYDEFNELLDEMSQDSDHELHTVHSAKGLEAHTVIVLGDWFRSDQTENMKYVAYTRAEDRLLLVEDWEREEDEL
jgi:superfamily I DNA/RNA helicase